MTNTLSPLGSETPIAYWKNLCLTTQRVYSVAARDDGSEWTSALLDQVDWVAIRRIHQPAFLLLAGLFVTVLPFGALLMLVGDGDSAIAAISFFVGAFVGTVFLIAYYVSRRIELRIGAGSGLITAIVSGAQAELSTAWSFLAEVQERALARRDSRSLKGSRT